MYPTHITNPVDGVGDEITITIENVRLALENRLQDHSYADIGIVKGNFFVIEPMTEEDLTEK
jgi:hypothetical protein